MNADDEVLAGIMRRILTSRLPYIETYDDGECIIDVRIYITDEEARVMKDYVGK